MPQSSIKGYYEEVDGGGLTADKPCDTSRVWTILDNIQHMCDSSPRYIVNMCDTVAFEVQAQCPQVEAIAPVAALNLEFTFPMCVLNIKQYPAFDVRLACHVTSASGTVSLNAQVLIGSMNAASPGDSADPNIIGELSAATTSSTSVVLLDGLIVPATNNIPMFVANIPTKSLADGTSEVNANYWVGKVFVNLTAVVGNGGDTIFLDLLQIREYPS